MAWKQTAQAKREALLSSIPQEWKLTPEELGGRTKNRNVMGLIAKRIPASARGITEIPVSRLLQKLQQGDVTASEVLVREPLLEKFLYSFSPSNAWLWCLGALLTSFENITRSDCESETNNAYRLRSLIVQRLPINW